MTQTDTLTLYRGTGEAGLGWIAAYAVLGIAAATFWWLCASHAATLPFWAPWDFSWVEFLGLWLAVLWYVRGLLSSPPGERPWFPRQIAFYAGMAVIYAVLETRFEYLAEHMFFLNRIQHVAMHHLGPLLIALAWPGAMILRGMPAPLRRVLQHPAVRGMLYVVQQPALAAFLFVGLIFLWLIPSVHFRAMIDPTLYSIMNWSMVIDGILFWCLVLDPRPLPQARTSFGVRALVVMIVMMPQIVVGSMIVFSPHDLYLFYDLCGRIYPSVDAHYDQVMGGIIIWIPPAMMSILGLILVLNALRRADNTATEEIDDGSRTVINASQWTGM